MQHVMTTQFYRHLHDLKNIKEIKNIYLGFRLLGVDPQVTDDAVLLRDGDDVHRAQLDGRVGRRAVAPPRDAPHETDEAAEAGPRALEDDVHHPHPDEEDDERTYATGDANEQILVLKFSMG